MNRSERRTQQRRTATRAVVAGLVVTAAGAAFTPGVSQASSHREAPLTATDPDIDNTDTYAFNSPDKPDTVTLITNVKPFQLPAGGPNFDPFGNSVRYNLKINTTGDAKAQLTYRFTFSGGFQDKNTFLYNTGPVNSINDATLNFKQNYKVELIDASGAVKSTIVANGRAAPANVGMASMPNYALLRDQSLATGRGANGTRTFAGPADDPFFIDLRVFDLLYGANLSETGNPTLNGLNVSSIAVQVPKSVLAAAAGTDTSHVIGVYATTERRSALSINPDGTRTATGNWVQVSRVGNPLVNEVVSSVALKDAFNALPPEKDAGVPGLVNRVLMPEVPQRIQKVYGIPAPPAPRNDLKTIFLTGIKGLNQPTNPTPAELLRLNTSTPVTANPNRLGLLAGDTGGFPNGRRLTDDVVDIEVQALEGAFNTPDGKPKVVQALKNGDGVNQNDLAFGKSFPYVALPHSGSTPGNGSLGGGTTSPGGGSSATGTMPTGGVNTGAGGAARSASDSTPLLPVSAGLLGVLLASGGAIALRRARA